MAGNLCFMKSNPNPLGEWIRNGLMEIGRNQVWLAEKVGVQAPQISRIINGGSETSPELLSAIADALGKPRAQIFRVAGYLEKISEDDEWVEETNYKLKKIPHNLRGVATALIDGLLDGNSQEKRRSKAGPASPKKV